MIGFCKRLLFFSPLFLCYSAAHCAESADVSTKAYKLHEIFGLPITNAMITSWFFSILLIVIVRFAVGKKPRLIPSHGQAVVESMLEGIRNTVEPIVGKRMIAVTFPLLIGYFAFILIQNWSGLLPGVGTFGHYDQEGHLLYFFRPANSDLNMTLALASVSMVAWLYYCLRYEGAKSIIHHLFGNKAEKGTVHPLLYGVLFFVFIFVGLIEVVSILLRLVSLSFRLFGNVFGGENLLNSMHSLSASIHKIASFVIPVPFYFLEMLIGLIQALVFTLLVAVYIGLMCNHDN